MTNSLPFILTITGCLKPALSHLISKPTGSNFSLNAFSTHEIASITSKVKLFSSNDISEIQQKMLVQEEPIANLLPPPIGKYYQHKYCSETAQILPSARHMKGTFHE